MSDIPEHRSAVAPRNGDDHLIGEDGELRNVEQEARDAAAAAAAAEQEALDATAAADAPAPRRGRSGAASDETEQAG
jgi:hypothetical protein